MITHSATVMHFQCASMPPAISCQKVDRGSSISLQMRKSFGWGQSFAWGKSFGWGQSFGWDYLPCPSPLPLRVHTQAKWSHMHIKHPKVHVQVHWIIDIPGGIVQLLQHLTKTPGTILTQVGVPGVARDFSPTVSFQCRLSYSVQTVPVGSRMHQHTCRCSKSQTVAAKN